MTHSTLWFRTRVDDKESDASLGSARHRSAWNSLTRDFINRDALIIKKSSEPLRQSAARVHEWLASLLTWLTQDSISLFLSPCSRVLRIVPGKSDVKACDRSVIDTNQNPSLPRDPVLPAFATARRQVKVIVNRRRRSPRCKQGAKVRRRATAFESCHSDPRCLCISNPSNYL